MQFACVTEFLGFTPYEPGMNGGRGYLVGKYIQAAQRAKAETKKAKRGKQKRAISKGGPGGGLDSSDDDFDFDDESDFDEFDDDSPPSPPVPAKIRAESDTLKLIHASFDKYQPELILYVAVSPELEQSPPSWVFKDRALGCPDGLGSASGQNAGSRANNTLKLSEGKEGPVLRFPLPPSVIAYEKRCSSAVCSAAAAPTTLVTTANSSGGAAAGPPRPSTYNMGISKMSRWMWVSHSRIHLHIKVYHPACGLVSLGVWQGVRSDSLANGVLPWALNRLTQLNLLNAFVGAEDGFQVHVPPERQVPTSPPPGAPTALSERTMRRSSMAARSSLASGGAGGVLPKKRPRRSSPRSDRPRRMSSLSMWSAANSVDDPCYGPDDYEP